jgi:hypothetical protein
MSTKYLGWRDAGRDIREIVDTFNIYIYRDTDTGDFVISYLDRKAVRDRVPVAHMERFESWYNEWVNWFMQKTNLEAKLDQFAALPPSEYKAEKIRQTVGKCMKEVNDAIEKDLSETLFNVLI